MEYEENLVQKKMRKEAEQQQRDAAAAALARAAALRPQQNQQPEVLQVQLDGSWKEQQLETLGSGAIFGQRADAASPRASAATGRGGAFLKAQMLRRTNSEPDLLERSPWCVGETPPGSAGDNDRTISGGEASSAHRSSSLQRWLPPPGTAPSGAVGASLGGAAGWFHS